MIIRYLSDLHLEVGSFILPEMLDDSITTLVLAGDICTVYKYKKLENFLINCSNQFKEVIYIAGNHEFYHLDYHETIETLISMCKPIFNIFFLHNNMVTIDGISFIGSTLWSDFNESDPRTVEDCQNFMNDFKLIKYEDKIFNPYIARNIHEYSKKYLFETIIEEKLKGNKVVIVTHHGLSPKSIHPKYRLSTINGAFYSDLEEEIIAHKPDCIIQGHTHESFIYRLGNSMVYVNPRGYIGYEYNGLFNPTANFEL